MLEWIQRVMATLGYPGIVLLMCLENAFPPLPSALIMPLAGFATAQGTLAFAGVVAAGTRGAVLGALPLYALGRTVGARRRRWLADTDGAWLTVSGADLDRAQGWFARHGGRAVLICRLVPGIRALIAIPAGRQALPRRPFLRSTTLGSAAWVAFLTYLGRLLGQHYALVERYVGPLASVVLGGLALAALGWVLWRTRHARTD